MKEINAIIRMNRMNATKEALTEAGFTSLTAQKVMGRGKQRGLIGEFAQPVPVPGEGELPAPSFIPKRMLTLLVADEDVDRVVDVLVGINQTGEPGDGKIFISAVKRLSRIRTGERATEAI